MVGHQDPGPDLDIGRTAGLRKEIAIEPLIGICKEGLRPAVAALRHVMRHPRDHEATKAANAKSIADRLSLVNLVHCQVVHHFESDALPTATVIDERGEVWKAAEDRRQRGDAVIDRGERRRPRRNTLLT
jgi:hypothetical protein